MALADIEGRPLVANGRRSLRADLHRMGIPTPIRPARVAAHIAADQAECRPTPQLRLIGLIWMVLMWGALIPTFRLLFPRWEWFLRLWNSFVISLIISVVSISWILGYGAEVGAILALVPIFSWAALILLSIVWEEVFDKDPTLERAVSFWVRLHPRSIWAELPPSVQLLVRDLEAKLPDAKLRVLARGDDPFLEVSRAGERVFVAAWDTGDETLDYVPLRT